MSRTQGIGLLALVIAGSAAWAGDPQRPFDFSDAFYLANGVDPAKIIDRPDGTPPNSVIDNTNTDPNRRNVRVLQTIPTFDHSGHEFFFNVFGLLPANAFTSNAAGQQALDIAESFPLYIFPRAANAPFTVFPKRQEDLTPLNGGYFGNNPLGLWQFNFVRFTPAGTGTPVGQAALAELADRNGLDLDGTPVIRTESELLNLVQQGFAEILVPEPGGSQGPRWFICPVTEDPRGGAIAPDAFLETVNGANGQPIASSQTFRWQFNCLQVSGDFCRDIPPCFGDFNNDGNLTVADFTAMQASFVLGQNAADLNLSGTLTIADFSAFQAAFIQGCP